MQNIQRMGKLQKLGFKSTVQSIRNKILRLVEFKGEWLSKRSATSLTHFTSPTGDYNGTQYEKSVLEFSANDAIGVFPDYAVTKDFELTMVLNMPDYSGNQSLIPFSGATLGLFKKRSGLDNTIAINDGGSTPERSLTTAIPAGWKKLKWVYDYSTTIHRIYINDIEQSWNGNNDDFDLTGFTFQSFSSITHDFVGQLAELKIEDADGVFFSYDGEGRLGSTVIDKSGNGRHMTTSVVTHTNVNEPLLKNHTNEDGYTIQTFAETSQIEAGVLVDVISTLTQESDGIVFPTVTASKLVIEDNFKVRKGDSIDLKFTVSENSASFGVRIMFTSLALSGIYAPSSDTALTGNTVTLSSGYVTDNGTYDRRLVAPNNLNEYYVVIDRVYNHTGTQKISNISMVGNSIIPRDESDITKDALGNDLQFKGKVRPDMKKEGSSCIQLDGSNGAGTLGTAVTLTGDFTASFHFNASSYPFYLAGQDDNTSVFELKSGGVPRVRINSTNYDGTYNFATGTEYKITFSRVGSNVLVYLDDILLETISAATGDMNFDKIGNKAASLYSTGKIFGIEFGGKEYPISEVVGTTSYARNDRTKQIAWTGGATHGLQNSYHSSVNDGFTKGVNHLPFSENQVFGDPSLNNWTKLGSQVITTNNLDAFGTNTAFSSTLNVLDGHFDFYRRVEGLTANVEYTFSWYVKLGTATDLAVVVNNGLAWNTLSFNRLYTAADGLNTSTFTRIDYNFTPITSNVNLHIGKNAQTNPTAPQSTGTAFFCFPQLQKGSVATPYQKTDASPTAGAELPYKIGGVYSNPAILPSGYNGAITKGKMVAFREDLAAIVPFYDQSTFASNTINLATLPANTSDQLLLDTTDALNRKNLIAGVPDFTGSGLALVEKYTNQ